MLSIQTLFCSLLFDEQGLLCYKRGGATEFKFLEVRNSGKKSVGDVIVEQVEELRAQMEEHGTVHLTYDAAMRTQAVALAMAMLYLWIHCKSVVTT